MFNDTDIDIKRSYRTNCKVDKQGYTTIPETSLLNKRQQAFFIYRCLFTSFRVTCLFTSFRVTFTSFRVTFTSFRTLRFHHFLPRRFQHSPLSPLSHYD
jgi:hypothetical protein